MKRFLSLVSAMLVVATLLAGATVGAAPKQADRGAWAPGVAYAVGDTVTYNGVVYKCIQAHTSQTGWEPPNVPALWQPIGTPTPGGGATATRTPTRTNTPSGATATRTPTRTNTPAAATNTPTRTNTPAAATNTPAPTNTPTRTPTSSGAACWPAWDANTAYNGGAQVSYNGVNYQAAYWTQGQRPDLYSGPAGSGQPWIPMGACGGGGATNTPTRTNTPAAATSTPTRTNTPSDATNTPTHTNTPAVATNTPTPTNTPAGATATHTPTPSSSGLPKHILVGYWHNFDNGSGFIKLRNVSTKFDVINIAFAEPVDSNGNIGFTPYSGTSAEEIKSDVAYLHSIGKKVLISIGGQNGQVQLNSSTAVNNFINSVSNIISTYGLDGLDIDFEGHSLYLNTGDADFTNPTTPVIVNTINAIRGVRNRFGSNFILSMAPETFFVQLGYSFYGGTCLSCDTRAGAYLPVLYATRDILTYIHVQDYNSGPIIALDNVYYSMGNADFHVAMTEMLLVGFPVAGTGKTFPALRQDQVAFGVPATVNAGNGYIPPAEIQKALDYLVKGISFGGSYRLRNPSGYPNLRGVMTWSINWDAFSGFSFSNPIGTYLDNLP
jgi:chitinase